VILLVHHGEAADPIVDAQRALTADGRAAVERLAQEAAGRGVEPVEIWHSGKLRARQTAEAYWRACNPLAEYSATRWAQPGDPPRLADLLEVEARDVMLVGHLPHLDRLLRRLLGEDESLPPFPVNGLVAIERVDEAWVERWRLAAPPA
jgi:phosphohistidine phosphatase